MITIEKQVVVPKSEDGDFFWIDPKKTKKLPMPTDLKKYMQILAKDPNAFILGYFDHNEDGKIINEKLNILG